MEVELRFKKIQKNVQKENNQRAIFQLKSNRLAEGYFADGRRVTHEC
jgi:hypothetical protein